MTAPIVIKVSGHGLDDPAYLADFAAVVRDLTAPVIIVHGGGKEITELQAQLGIEPRYVDGLRVTDPDSLRLVEMVLRGTVNMRVVRALVNAGLDAQGLCGVDRGLVRAQPMQHPTESMGFTGLVESVRGDILTGMLARGILPVLAPLCLSVDGASALNVNADHVSAAVAGAVGASRLVFLSNVSGVQVNGAVVPSLSSTQVESYITDGTIFGGMIPKVRMALDVLGQGVAQSLITDLDGLRNGGGTVFQEKA